MKSNGSSPSGSDVIVIGGGFHGISSAFFLSRRGAKVAVLEADYCARHASGVNAGGVRTLARDVKEVAISRASLRLWHNVQDLVDDDCTFVPSGHLQIAESAGELERLRARASELDGLGFSHEVLVDAQQAREIVPGISDHVVGGLWVDDDGHAIPYRAVAAFRLAAQRLGATVHENTPALSIERIGARWHVTTPQGVFTAPWLVNAAGAWSGEFAAKAGDDVPLRPRGLMLMITQRVPHFINPVLIGTGRPLSFKQFANGTVLIGGSLFCDADMGARHGEVDFHKLASSARTVTEVFPHLAGVNVVRAWAGVEAFMPDGIPVISMSRHAPQLVHAFGFSAHGFALGPIGGQLVSELVLDGETSLPTAAFAADRFPSYAPHARPPVQVSTLS